MKKCTEMLEITMGKKMECQIMVASSCSSKLYMLYEVRSVQARQSSVEKSVALSWLLIKGCAFVVVRYLCTIMATMTNINTITLAKLCG